jgi:hypothetical protein
MQREAGCPDAWSILRDGTHVQESRRPAILIVDAARVASAAVPSAPNDRDDMNRDGTDF